MQARVSAPACILIALVVIPAGVAGQGVPVIDAKR